MKFEFYPGILNIIHDKHYQSKGETSVEDLLRIRRRLGPKYKISWFSDFRLISGSIVKIIVDERY